jgi:hypothetical protein
MHNYIYILETVKIILERNVFYFDGKFYRQKRGTAMGTKMAPTYATLNNISVILWQLVLLVEETEVPRENQRPAVSN